MSKLTDEKTEKKETRIERCLSAALGYLSYRPRGEAELRGRLTRRGFAKDVQDAVVARLSEDGLLNDEVFAQFWKDARDYFKPRSKWMTEQELKQKGISGEIIEQVISTIDDEDNAYRAGLEKAQRLAGADFETFSRKIGAHLHRRGFSSSVIKHAIKKVWEDKDKPSAKTNCSCSR